MICESPEVQEPRIATVNVDKDSAKAFRSTLQTAQHFTGSM